MVFELFKRITAIPHCSFKTEALRRFIVSFIQENGFIVETDEAGNILAYRNRREIALQAHYDMVCVGDYETIEIVEEKGVLKAKNSSLGADNGIGVAMMLSLMKEGIKCEYLFTNDEEVGLIGANALGLSLEAKKLINLDSEEEESLYIGCAGGFDATIRFSDERVEYKGECFEKEISGLPGGHSGLDIDKGHKNAILELINSLDEEVKIVSIMGGERRNSIPVNAKARFFKESENGECKTSFLKDSDQIKHFLQAFQNGVRGSDTHYGVVKQSANVALIQENEVIISFRANDNELLEVYEKEIHELSNHYGATCKVGDAYPAWKPQPSDLAKNYADFSHKKVKVIHAGLECAVLGKYIDAEMISIGPNIFEPHSIRERVEIASVKREYERLKSFLKGEKK